MRAILLLPVLVLMLTFSTVCGEVFVSDNEYAGYFDSDGIYTVVGVVKNTEDYAVVSHVSVSVSAGGKIISAGHDLPSVDANKDMPFKILIPQVLDRNIVLERATVTFQRSDMPPPSGIHVVYDKTLVRHDDGHVTGMIVNDGNDTKYNVRVYAAIHGENNKFIDTGANVENIEKIEPGQAASFSIYPDQSVASDVRYYSCFNIGDETVVPLRTTRNGADYNFRYDSTAAFTVDGFDKTGTMLSISGINSFKIPTFVNFEFPRTSDSEKFAVHVNGEPVQFIQSQDETGNWHVAFDIDSTAQDSILISGFENPGAKPVSGGTETLLYLYVIPVVMAAGIGVYLYKRRN